MEFFENSLLMFSNVLWSIFLPIMVVVSIFVIIKFFVKVQGITTKKSTIKISEVVGPVTISLGTMIGTGAIIGVLGSISSLYIAGQNYFEAIVGWAIIGSLILLPIAYIETIISKTTNLTPKEYIAKLLSPKLAYIYSVSFVILHILGFGGFQFQGINSTITIIAKQIGVMSPSLMQRYIFIIIPLIIFVSLIVLTKKHKLFIDAMSILIGIAVSAYLLFVLVFIFKTNEYIPLFFSNMFEGMKNPLTSVIGVPMGMMLSFQRIFQTSEPGLGAFAISSLESNSKPRSAGLVSLGTSLVTVFIAIMTTSYIVSYGFSNSIINLSINDSLNLLEGFFLTGFEVTGIFGVVIMMLFTILAGITTLLGSYYFLSKLFNLNENTEIRIFIVILSLAGTISIFGGSIIFEIVDLLLFVVAAINILAVTVYVTKRYKDYKIKE